MAVRADETDPWARSLALEAQGKYKEAAALIEPFINGGGDATEYATLRYGWLQYLMRNYSESLRAYDRALRLNPESFDARLGKTLPLLAQGRWEEVARLARQVLERSPWHFVAHVRLLMAEEGLHQWAKLRRHASELAARYPASPLPWVYLARAEAWLGNYAAARRAYAQVLRRVPGHLEALHFLHSDRKGM